MTPRRFCPFCGKPNEAIPGARHRKCAACGETDWQNPAPAVGVALVRDGAVLLSRRARPPKKGEWDLVGGFVDDGETPEAAASREVREETGCRAVGLVARGQATGDYGGVATLNFLFTARLDGEPEAHDDSAELRWFPLAEAPRLAWPHEDAFIRSLRNLRE
jgi:8-oxo-dGTP diphosphatase